MRARGFHSDVASRGFTLIEIAIALAVIGFAVVAIIGVLPTGIQVQQDNKEETIAGQDGALLLDVIRGGSEGLPGSLQVLDLENYVDGPITVGPAEREVSWSDSRDIIGLLSAPTPDGAWTNHAVLRAISGSAVDKGSLVGFKYRASVRNVPFVLSTTGRSTNEVDQLRALLHDVTVELRWPVYRDGTLGAERRTFRALVSGELELTNNVAGDALYFFRNR